MQADLVRGAKWSKNYIVFFFSKVASGSDMFARWQKWSKMLHSAMRANFSSILIPLIPQLCPSNLKSNGGEKSDDVTCSCVSFYTQF